MAPSPTTLPAGVSVEVRQLRGDLAFDRLQLHVENGTTADLTLTSLRLESSVLAAPAEWNDDGSATVRAGGALNLPVELPSRVCTGDDPAPAVSGTTRDDDGDHVVTAPASDPLGVLRRLSEEACAAADVAAVAELRVVGVTTSDTGGFGIRIAVRPSGGSGSMRLVELSGTPLLRFPDGDTAPLALEVHASDDASEIVATLTPARCDAHAIAEDKVGTLFTLTADVAGVSRTVTLPRDADVAAALLTATARACGLE